MFSIYLLMIRIRSHYRIKVLNWRPEKKTVDYIEIWMFLSETIPTLLGNFPTHFIPNNSGLCVLNLNCIAIDYVVLIPIPVIATSTSQGVEGLVGSLLR